MKTSELIKLKKCFNLELERVNRIKELSNLDSVKEFIKLANINIKKLNHINDYKI